MSTRPRTPATFLRRMRNEWRQLDAWTRSEIRERVSRELPRRYPNGWSEADRRMLFAELVADEVGADRMQRTGGLYRIGDLIVEMGGVEGLIGDNEG